MFEQLKRAFLLGAVVTLPAPLSAQEAPQAVFDAVQALEDDWARAYQTRDGEILERILGEEFYVVGWEGEQYSRQDEIDATVSSTDVLTRVTNKVLDVRQYGEVVIAIGEFRGEGTTADGDSFRRAGTWFSVFVQRDGGLVAVAGHTAPLPE